MNKKIVSLFAMFVFAFAFAFVAGLPAHAAADPLLTGAIASGTAMIDDNAGTVISFIISIVTKIAMGGLGIAVIYFGIGKIKSLIAKRRAKRR